MRGWVLLSVVVFAACECGPAGTDDAGADDLQQPLEVRLNGVALPSQATWSFDAAANAVVFTPTGTPPPGAQVTVEYSAACAP